MSGLRGDLEALKSSQGMYAVLSDDTITIKSDQGDLVIPVGVDLMRCLTSKGFKKSWRYQKEYVVEAYKECEPEVMINRIDSLIN